jgi:hypothetical protein
MNVYWEEEFLKGSDITEIFKEVWTKTNFTDCEYVVITSIDNKISLIKEKLSHLLHKAKDYNKRVVFLGQGDVEEGYIPEGLGYNFKNNLYKTKKYKNEFSLTSLAPERTPAIHFTPYTKDISVGFCGATNRFNRDFYLNEIKKLDIRTNFIIKNGPQWGTETPTQCTNNDIIKNIQKKSKELFYNNILENLFTLCVRGWGNYSYRFCQTICLGRIPILIDTDCCLPYEEIFDYTKYIVIVKSGENINEKINEFIKQNSNHLHDIQKDLYNFGEKYLKPHSYLKNIDKLIKWYERTN